MDDALAFEKGDKQELPSGLALRDLPGSECVKMLP